MKTRYALVLGIGSCLFLAHAAMAHGGQYRGPGDVVPKAFVSTITPVPATPAAVMAEMRTFTGQGLQTVMDLPYT